MSQNCRNQEEWVIQSTLSVKKSRPKKKSALFLVGPKKSAEKKSVEIDYIFWSD